MSNEHLTWAKSVLGLKPSHKLVLLLVADRVSKSSGCWQIKMANLIEETGLSRSSVRMILDNLAWHGLLAFKAECYRGKAQAAHTFFLTRNNEERLLAVSSGFSFQRREISRSNVTSEDNELRSTHSGAEHECTLVQHSNPQRKPNEYKQPNLPTVPSTMIDLPKARCEDQDESKPRWEKFNSFYPQDILDPEEPARKIFYSLSALDQTSAVAAAQIYFKTWKERGLSGRPVFRKRWLEERRWESVVVGASAQSEGPVGYPIYEGTAAHEAWAKALKAEGKKWFAPLKDKDGRAYCVKRTRLPSCRLLKRPLAAANGS